jgi:hypothetical protein
VKIGVLEGTYLLMWRAEFLSVVAWHYVYGMKVAVSLASVSGMWVWCMASWTRGFSSPGLCSGINKTVIVASSWCSHITLPTFFG